jgi:SOS-response transcriptional repressor LexA
MASRALRRVPRYLGYRCVQVKRYVEEAIERDGIAPSYGMIRDDLDFCDLAAVSRVVQNLERHGHLRRAGSGRVRRIRLVVNNK